MDETAECYWACENCLTDYDPDREGGFCGCGEWLVWVDELIGWIES